MLGRKLDAMQLKEEDFDAKLKHRNLNPFHLRVEALASYTSSIIYLRVEAFDGARRRLDHRHQR